MISHPELGHERACLGGSAELQKSCYELGVGGFAQLKAHYCVWDTIANKQNRRPNSRT